MVEVGQSKQKAESRKQSQQSFFFTGDLFVGINLSRHSYRTHINQRGYQNMTWD
jgi:hypothetical protein